MISNRIPAAQTCLKYNSHSVKLFAGTATHSTLWLNVFMWHRWIAGNECFYSARVSEFTVLQSLPHLMYSSQIITKGSVWCVTGLMLSLSYQGSPTGGEPAKYFSGSNWAEINNVWKKCIIVTTGSGTDRLLLFVVANHIHCQLFTESKCSNMKCHYRTKYNFKWSYL